MIASMPSHIGQYVSLENELPGKLDITRVVEPGCARHRAEIQTSRIVPWVAGIVPFIDRRIRIARAGMIEEIRGLRAKLKLDAFSNRERFKDREVHIAITRAVQLISR